MKNELPCPLCGREMTAIETYAGRGELYCDHCDLVIGGNEAKTPGELNALLEQRTCKPVTEKKDESMGAELFVMSENEPHTLNVDGDGGFWCLMCNHFISYTDETEWGETGGMPNLYMHMHGTEKFHFCPNCGRRILTVNEWAESHPEDIGKTFAEIRRRFV